VNRVVNCTVLSNFAAVGRLDLLCDTIGPLYLPTEVYDEILAGQMAGYTFYDGIEQHIHPFTPDGWLRLVTMTEEELQLFASLPARFHRGERACLCIARQRGWGVLTDDRAAREQARAWNLLLSGTLGVLLLAIQDGRLPVDEGDILLGRMIQKANYRSPVTDLKLLLGHC
jgi:predicted nucleic acid-binding protein